MPFNPKLIHEVNTYIENHLPLDEKYYEDYFSYINDKELKEVLVRDFMSARYVYKFFEGMNAKGWKQIIQIRIQIFLYASIYEAIIHHLLFVDFKDHELVIKLKTGPQYKQISVSKELDGLIHDNKKILTMYKVDKPDRVISTIRFDDKVNTFFELGFISEDLAKELKEIYSLRNALHLHAELGKDLTYTLNMSKVAYRRMIIFHDQVISNFKIMET